MEEPDPQAVVYDCLETELPAEYPIDRQTENWIINGDGKQVFFNLLVQIFTTSQQVPAAVLKYTAEKFNHSDSTIRFVKEVLKPFSYSNQPNSLKKVLRLKILDIQKLYQEYCVYHKLGQPGKVKHLKETVLRYGYTVVRSKNGLEIKGVIVNTELILKIILGNQRSSLT